jgi:tetratricopeptide (TPR) repeat protein
MNGCRWLPALAVLAALAIESPVAIAHAAVQAPPANPQLAPAPGATQAQPTAEDVGDSLMAHQHYQAAIDSYRKAPPNSATALNKMGIAHQMMFNLNDAARCYQASLKLDPTNARVFNNLGTVYDSLKQYGNAERMYRRALKLSPNSALILKNLGTDLLAQHKYKKGWEAYKAALVLDPEIFENTGSPRVENPATVQERGAMNYYMAKGCVRAGQNDRAIEYLRMALNEGFTTPKKIIADAEFAALRGLPAFEQLLAAQSSQQ